jgi:hypothetical protein
MGGFAFFCRYDVLSRLRVNIFFSLSLSLSQCTELDTAEGYSKRGLAHFYSGELPGYKWIPSK